MLARELTHPGVGSFFLLLIYQQQSSFNLVINSCGIMSLFSPNTFGLEKGDFDLLLYLFFNTRAIVMRGSAKKDKKHRASEDRHSRPNQEVVTHLVADKLTVAMIKVILSNSTINTIESQRLDSKVLLHNDA